MKTTAVNGPESIANESKIPESKACESKVPGSKVPGSKVSGAQAPASDAPASKALAGEAAVGRPFVNVRLWQGCAAAVLALAVLLPPARHVLEQSMALHMLLQYPVLVLAGMLLAGQLKPAWRARVARWNTYGITGLAFVAIASALGMVPRLLDLALVDARIEIVKCIVLVLCGTALRLSWRPAGVVVQFFFLGNVLPMMAIAGSLYIETPLRLCNAYRLDEQVWVGQGLTWLAAGLGALWLARAGWRYTRDDGLQAGKGTAWSDATTLKS